MKVFTINFTGNYIPMHLHKIDIKRKKQEFNWGDYFAAK